MNFAVTALDGMAAEACAIAERFGLPYVKASEARYALVLTEKRLELHEKTDTAPGPIYVDFVGGAVGHRRRFGGGRGQPIAKAAGLKSGLTHSVLDATAGLGRDAFIYASLGCTVTLVERSPIAAALIEDGLRRAEQHEETAPIVARMRLVHAEARTYMTGLDDESRPDVIYLDPMFPHREKAALVKKEMRAFQAVIGADDDADTLLAIALATARKRVVVKRPLRASPLGARSPTLTFTTKNHRFDAYVIAAMSCAPNSRGA